MRGDNHLLRLTRLPRLHTFDSWIRYREYRLLWTANFFSNSAQWFQLLSVGWLVQSLTAGSPTSALQVVTVGGISTLPVLLVGPWGGVLGDRVDRRKLIMLSQAVMATAGVLFALLVASGNVQVWQVYGYVLFIGVFLSITRPVRQAMIANTVPREAFGNAYAANTFTIAGTRMIGPFFGGVVLATLGFTWNFLVEASLYAVTVLVLLPMKLPYRSGAQASGQPTRNPSGAGPSGRLISPLADLREGVRFIWRGERAIFNLMFLSLIPNVIMNPVLFLLPVFTSEVLHRGADVGGYLLAATGFGALASAVTIASVGFIFRKGRVVLGSVVVGSVSLILFAHAPWLALTFIFLILMSAALNAFRTSEGTLVQLLTPDRLRGRVTGLQSYGQGLVVLSSLVIGWFAGITSITIVITSIGGVSLVLAIWALVSSDKIRQLE